MFDLVEIGGTKILLSSCKNGGNYGIGDLTWMEVAEKGGYRLNQ